MPLGLRAGLAQQQIDGLDGYAAGSLYGEPQKAVIRFAEEMTENVAAGDATFKAVREVVGEQEMVELCLTIALANLTNRLNETFQTELEH